MVRGGPVVSVPDCQAKRSEFKSRAEIWFVISTPLATLTNLAMMSAPDQ